LGRMSEGEERDLEYELGGLVVGKFEGRDGEDEEWENFEGGLWGMGGRGMGWLRRGGGLIGVRGM
ncbi:hypothetical protein, partial [Kocuria rhizophila]|uniref:hypothetical protein n=1 Tax=Kocuria rhizophila TaxID=72000 RepID=UPI001C930718